MILSAQRLNRATLHRQLLLQREPVTVPDAVRRIVAIQAQSPPSPYLALWNRIDGFDATELDAAFAAHDILKATLMRVTLHAVGADDYVVFQTALRDMLRRSGLRDPRFTVHGLSAADVDALVRRLLAYAAEPRSSTDLDTFVRAHVPDPAVTPGPWWVLRRFTPLVHMPDGGPWSFGPRPSYRVAPIDPSTDERDACVAHLVRRYLSGFGPAGVADVAQFAMLGRGVVRSAIDLLGDEVEHHVASDGRAMFDVTGASLPDEDVTAPPRLMPMWDSTLLAYADRSRIIPSAYRAFVIRNNGDVLPAVLVDGMVAGVWRAVDGGIEVSAFRPLSAGDWDGLAAEAAELVAFLAYREPLVYSRYRRWWAGLPVAQTRVFAG